MFIELKDTRGKREVINLGQVKRILPLKEGVVRMFFEDSMDRFVLELPNGNGKDEKSQPKGKNKVSWKVEKLISKGPRAYHGFKDYTVDYSTIMDFLQNKKVLLAKLSD